ncbi:MAG TPA: virulence factor BrkB family protein [Gammaproteobacteria bacterium]|jgi:membrane protein|nr:virulence factor BrkB family protein [Gammaproteobacteria bacterium]|tara:strand:+ start:3710 stop:4579 length:870 start_codon:yes stop_codon:yes gene_type:complete
MTGYIINSKNKFFMFFQIIFARTSYILRHFYLSNAMQVASSLAFTSLLSLVPLLTVMFGLFGEISVLQNFSTLIQNFIFANFVPEFGQTIEQYIYIFSMKASQLTISGSVFLVLIAMMLLATIDNSFNRIWKIKKKRNPIKRILIYFSLLIMGPLLIGIGLALTSYLLSIPVIADVDTTFNVKTHLLGWLPFLMTSIAFILLYILVPNCYVYKKYAVSAGVICAILFELAKYGFGIYVKEMSGYENIYGALAILPLFLVWIYISWVIILFGAHITFCLSSFYLNTINKS